uniref:Uncharacterized protein n=1 Tax=Xiphophorus couchianus TaxID=32473 RepID=A0A3B5MNN4_9TELE
TGPRRRLKNYSRTNSRSSSASTRTPKTSRSLWKWSAPGKGSDEKLSIYEAMRRRVLQHSTGLALLEAQAGTGFITDPVKKQKYSVDDAVKAGVVGPELHEKLLSAEKAVTGYKDPYTGSKISLFQAMKKELVLREHAIPILEAQITTGGIIDPVSSHRVPNDAAIQRGFFSKEMLKSFSEQTGDIKGFTNPNTNERVTYSQLLEKCRRDPNTGLCYLPLSKVEAPAVTEKSYEYTEEQAQQDLANTQIEIPHQSFAGKSLTIWEVMNSNIPNAPGAGTTASSSGRRATAGAARSPAVSAGSAA